MGNDKEPTYKDQLLSYLDEVIAFESSKLVGKLCKRVEIIEDRDTLKRELKELVYESFRDLRDIFAAYSKGVEVSYFNFKKEK